MSPLTTGETCCPACRAVGTSSFKSHFSQQNNWAGWRINPDISGCVCLDLAGSDYNDEGKDAIYFSNSADCARITGDNNKILARRPRRNVARREGPATARDAARREGPATARDAARAGL